MKANDIYETRTGETICRECLVTLAAAPTISRDEVPEVRWSCREGDGECDFCIAAAADLKADLDEGLFGW